MKGTMYNVVVESCELTSRCPKLDRPQRLLANSLDNPSRMLKSTKVQVDGLTSSCSCGLADLVDRSSCSLSRKSVTFMPSSCSEALASANKAESALFSAWALSSRAYAPWAASSICELLCVGVAPDAGRTTVLAHRPNPSMLATRLSDVKCIIEILGSFVVLDSPHSPTPDSHSSRWLAGTLTVASPPPP